MRVTAAEVIEILEETAPDKSLTPFITQANLVVTEEIEVLGVLSDDRLKEIERWLSAHFYCILSPRAMSESAGVSVSYEANSKAQGYQTTRYGMTACALDTTGVLTNVGTGKLRAKTQMVRLNEAG